VIQDEYQNQWCGGETALALDCTTVSALALDCTTGFGSVVSG
jgi:hypothetical protein